MSVPKIHDDIYVDSAFYLSRGVDDVVGGLAQVIKVSETTIRGKIIHFVEIAEHPGRSINWEQHLAPMQEKLKKEFGNKRAYPDPDNDPEANSWI